MESLLSRFGCREENWGEINNPKQRPSSVQDTITSTTIRLSICHVRLYVDDLNGLTGDKMELASLVIGDLDKYVSY
jgi:hypothetical protein